MTKVVCMALALVTAITVARADDARLAVGVSHYPPGAIKGADGSWSGMCVDAWKDIAREAGFSYTFVEVDPQVVIERGLEALDLDAFVCVSTTPRIEAKMDITHAFMIGGVGIATRGETTSSITRVARKLLDLHFLRSLGLLVLVIVVIGVIVWRVERHTSPDEFGGPPLKGIGGGIFWTVESLFSKPKPLSRALRSRLLALFWVIVCMVIISSITAKLASEFTVNQLSATIAGPKDLPHARVGAMIASNGLKGPATRYLERHGIAYRAFRGDTLRPALDALDRGEIDAVVDDFVTLQYLATTEYPGRLVVLPNSIAPKSIAFGLRPNSAWRKAIDTAIVKLVEEDDFKHINARYLGATE